MVTADGSVPETLTKMSNNFAMNLEMLAEKAEKEQRQLDKHTKPSAAA